MLYMKLEKVEGDYDYEEQVIEKYGEIEDYSDYNKVYERPSEVPAVFKYCKTFWYDGKLTKQ